MPTQYDMQDHIVTDTTDRPEAKNALDPVRFSALGDAWRRFRDDDDAWVAVITGVGDATCSAATEISAIVAEEAFWALQAPIVRVTTPDVQIPFSPALERQLSPTAAEIESAIRTVVNGTHA